MKRLLGSKKGLFYMYVSSIILLVVIALFLTQNEYGFVDKQEVVQTRIISINDFLSDIDSDSERVIYVSSFRSLIALEDYISKTGSYLNDTEETFKTAFYNGTINGASVDVLKNSTYQDYLAKLRQISLLSGTDIYLNVTDVTLYQDSPWSVKVIVTAHVYVNDTRGLAYWEFDKNYTTEVPLQNIRDPIYSVGTYGKVPNTIRQTNVTDFIDQATNSTLGLQIHNNNSFYYPNTNAPSFLMRLSGNFSPSQYGIESLVYTPELDTQGVSYESSKSIVDYVFFSNISGYTSKACSVKNMPTWFKIDLNHTSTYEVNTVTYSNC
jgi:hypothetical protein